jgi:hypothetical protein
MGEVRVGRGRVGGASGAAGVGYQEGVTAWLAAHLLAEDQAPPLPSLEAGVRVVRTASETGQPIDDLNGETSDGLSLYVQAKRAVAQLIDRDESDFTDFVGQAVDQHIALRTIATAPPARYILATSPDASSKIRRELRVVLDHLRDAPRDAALESVGGTEDQRTALATTAGIVRRLIRDRGEDPTDGFVRDVLERMVVWEVDIDGPARSTAITLLGATVVPTSTVAAQAWRVLEQRAGRAAAHHDVLDIHGWRRALRMEGLQLRGIPSFDADVARVRAHSARALADLGRHRLLRVGGEDVSVEREVGEGVHRLSPDGPLLVVGDPGSGKSGVLAGLAERLRDDGADVIVMDAEAVSSTSVGALSRELGLDHDVADVLEGWPDGPRGYLIADSLDETRGGPGTPTLRRLVEHVTSNGRWIPVVAVRRFDLRYSSDLQRIFDGPQAETRWTDAEFAGIRHVVVGDLSDAELDQLSGSAPALVAMAKDPSVGPLLRRPIHLQLAAELLARGASKADVARLRTQVQLLDLYWHRIVEEPVARRAARERVLTAACGVAVSDRRLSFRRSELDAVDPGATTDLLGAGILVEGEERPASGRLVRFLHGLVIDYAVARLLLSSAGAAEALLVSDPVNALLLRRSMELWLAGIWESERTRAIFWDVVLSICGREDVPEIARLVGPTIAAQSWIATEDIDRLLTALDDGRRSAALTALRHFVASLTAQAHPIIAGPDASPWSALAVRLTSDLATDAVFPVRLLVMLLAEARSDLTEAQLAHLGTASRSLLGWLWDADSPDMIAARFAILGVCASILSDPRASETLLRRGLCRGHATGRGYEELRHYAKELEALEVAPGLVVALYTAAFAFDDAGGSEPGVNLGGPILSIVSSRDQEFRMVRYELTHAFRGLMQRHPDIATSALLRVLRASSNLRRDRLESGPYVRFVVDGIEARVRDKWGAQTVAWLSSPDDEALLHADWSSGLASLAATGDARLQTSLQVFLRENHTYAGWWVLIDAAAREARLTALVARLVAQATPMLSASVVLEPLCRLLAAAQSQPGLAAELRAAMAAPVVDAEARTALIGCLEETALPPPDDEDQGVEDSQIPESPSAEAANPRRVLEKWLGEKAEEGAAVPESVRAAFESHAATLGPHDSAHEEDWYLATRAGDRIASIDRDCGRTEIRAVATVLLKALQPADGVADGSWDGVEDVETIASHACVLTAVDGVSKLHAAGACDEVITAGAMLALADHPLPWARSQLARVADRFVSREPDLAWSILEKLAGDRAPRVSADAVSIASNIRRRDPERARGVMARAIETHGMRPRLVGEAVVMLAGFLVIDDVEGIDRFGAVLDAADRMSDAGPILQALRSLIAPPAAWDSDGDSAHQAALLVVRAVASRSVARYREAARLWEEARDEADRERAQDAVRGLDDVVTQIYFASGAYQGKADSPLPTGEQMARLFDEIQGDFRDLLPHLAARGIHHVVEIAAANVDARPTEAFLLIADAVRIARGVGYETDQLAKDLVLGLIRGYMADRAGLFQGSTKSARAMQSALVTILDSFVAVGWPEAREMAYHLYEVLR